MEFAYRVEDGKVVALYPKCATHNWYYKGRPPIVHGCKECWLTYYFGQIASSPEKDKGELLEALESMLHHAVELIEAGKWDFKPEARGVFSVATDVADADVAKELSKGIHEE